jgi:hypothetical protein
MTQPSQQQVQLPLPNPNAPMVTRVITNALFPEESPKGPRGEPLLPPGFPRAEEPLTWVVGQKHPLDGNIQIVRMFRAEEGVEVYCVGYENGIRCFLPTHQVRFVEEGMPIDLFIEELAIAESDDDELGPGDPTEPPGPGEGADGSDQGPPFDDQQSNPALA